MSVSGFCPSLVQAICLSGACTQVEVASWQIQAAAALTHHSTQPSRPQRWSIFQGDGMVNVFFRPPTWDQNMHQEKKNYPW